MDLAELKALAEKAELPWHNVEPYVGCDGTEVNGAVFDNDDDSPGMMIGDFETRDKALFAVAACNSILDLIGRVEAAESLVGRLLKIGHCEMGPCGYCHCATHEDARKLLSQKG